MAVPRSGSPKDRHSVNFRAGFTTVDSLEVNVGMAAGDMPQETSVGRAFEVECLVTSTTGSEIAMGSDWGVASAGALIAFSPGYLRQEYSLSIDWRQGEKENTPGI